MAGKMGISEILQQGYKIIFKLWANTKLNADMMGRLVEEYGGRLMINGGKEPFIRLTINKEDPLKAMEHFLQIAFESKMS